MRYQSRLAIMHKQMCFETKGGSRVRLQLGMCVEETKGQQAWKVFIRHLKISFWAWYR